MIVLGTFTDFAGTFLDNEIVVFEERAAAFRISDDNFISMDTQDLEPGTHHLSRKSDRL